MGGCIVRNMLSRRRVFHWVNCQSTAVPVFGCAYGGRDWGSLQSVGCVYFLSAVHGRPVLLLGHDIVSVFLFLPLPRRHNRRWALAGLDFGPGPLETASVASPKVSGLPSVGVMRDFPTTPLGQRWWKPRDTHTKLRHFTCDVSK